MQSHGYSASAFDVLRYRSGARVSTADDLAVECPIALEFNGISHVVMLATPSDLIDFAVGFSLSEGLIDRPEEIFDIEVRPAETGIILEISVTSRCFNRIKQRRRSLMGRTGCGLCGIEALDALGIRPEPIKDKHSFSRQHFLDAVRRLPAVQPLQAQTGSTHAAAWLSASGDIMHVREDVGRHNAVDKLIGAVSKSDLSFSDGALVVTSRASIEIIQKAAALGIGFVAAISAPTSMAVELARSCGITLLGFLRGQDYVVYAREQDLTE